MLTMLLLAILYFASVNANLITPLNNANQSTTWKQTCMTGSECPLMAFCDLDGLCRCYDGYKYQDGKCNELKQNITTTVSSQECYTASDCMGQYTTCSGEGYCQCEYGYQLGPNGVDCVRPLHHTCFTNRDCGKGAACRFTRFDIDQPKCRCDLYFTETDSSEVNCVPSIKQCTNSYQCSKHAYCSSVTNRCQCESGYRGYDAYSCDLIDEPKFHHNNNSHTSSAWAGGLSAGGVAFLVLLVLLIRRCYYRRRRITAAKKTIATSGLVEPKPESTQSQPSNQPTNLAINPSQSEINAEFRATSAPRPSSLNPEPSNIYPNPNPDSVPTPEPRPSSPPLEEITDGPISPSSQPVYPPGYPVNPHYQTSQLYSSPPRPQPMGQYFPNPYQPFAHPPGYQFPPPSLPLLHSNPSSTGKINFQ